MGIVIDLLNNIPIPKMVRVKQIFPASAVSDIAIALRAEIQRPDISNRVKPGARIAVGVGSRGVANAIDRQSHSG